VEEIAALVVVPQSRWTAIDEVEAPREIVIDLVERGLLLCDGGGEEERSLRELDEAMGAAGWECFSALYHGMGRWRAHETSNLAEPPDDRETSDRSFRENEERFGPAPPAFHRRADATGSVPLPHRAPGDGETSGRLLFLLERRRNVRRFDRGRSMPLADFALLLATVFGAERGLRVTPSLTVLKKTSPSGGALHPIEAYPLVRDVDGVEPGLYHYDARGHRLERLRRLRPREGEELVEALLARQSHFRSAHAVVLLTARFERQFWKYREHKKSYRVAMMDAAHLSQTFYLVCTEHGLGACFTAAINDGDVDEVLALDGWREGAVAALACGIPAPDEGAAAFRPELLPDDPEPPAGADT
jgi:putative peptide maturation dehydrogenase